MGKCLLLLTLWLIAIFVVGNMVAPGLSRITYPQPLDLLVLAFIPIGAFHAAKHKAPKLPFLLYGCLASMVFVLNFTNSVTRPRTGLEPDVTIVIACVVMLAFGFVCRLAPATREKWEEWKRFPPGHCQKCGYNLTGNVSGICPECGEEISYQEEDQE